MGWVSFGLALQRIEEGTDFFGLSVSSLVSINDHAHQVSPVALHARQQIEEGTDFLAYPFLPSSVVVLFFGTTAD